MLVVASPERAEQALAVGQLVCPGCGGVLRPFGHARTRTVRGLGSERLTVTPRRSRCTGCRTSHVLLPTALSVRRADSTAAIGTALLANATDGDGHRVIAERMNRPVSTVRRWLRGVRGPHAEWLYQQGVAEAVRLDRELLAGATYAGLFKSTLWHALNILAGAARSARERYGATDAPWSLINLYPRGRLLAPPGRPKPSWSFAAAGHSSALDQPSVCRRTPSPGRARRHSAEEPRNLRLHFQRRTTQATARGWRTA